MNEPIQSIESRVATIERTLSSPTLNPMLRAILLNGIAVRYGTTAPTHTPDKETELWIIANGVDIRLWAWALSAWHYVVLT